MCVGVRFLDFSCLFVCLYVFFVCVFVSLFVCLCVCFFVCLCVQLFCDRNRGSKVFNHLMTVKEGIGCLGWVTVVRVCVCVCVCV